MKENQFRLVQQNRKHTYVYHTIIDAHLHDLLPLNNVLIKRECYINH